MSETIDEISLSPDGALMRLTPTRWIEPYCVFAPTLPVVEPYNPPVESVLFAGRQPKVQ